MSWRALTLHSKSRKNPVDDLLARIINLPAGLDVLVAVAAAGFSFVSAYVSNAPFVSLISAMVALSFAFLAVNAILREVRWINYLAAKASPEILSAMNRKEFEVFLTILFRLNGYKIRSAVNELHRQDDADWILNRKKENLLLQFNHFDEDSIGMQALQSLQKAALIFQASGAIAITTGHFLPEAKQWGDRKGLRLMTTDHLVEMAKQFMDTPSSLAAPHHASSRKNGGSELKTKTPSECVLFVDFSGVSSGLEALNDLITSFPLTRLIATTLLGRPAVTKKEIPQLTPALALAYSTCGPKTLSRDLNELLSLELIVESDAGYTAREEVLLNLLPLVVSDASDPLLPPSGDPASSTGP